MPPDRDPDNTLAESSVTLQLALIQKRCNDLINRWDGPELSLEEPLPPQDNSDPYNQG